MKRKHLAVARWFLLLVVFCFGGMGLARGASAPPNFLIILLDNVGQDWFGCYGSVESQTPRLDRLAQEGLRFEHCYVMPLCSTSRHVLLTGRYPFRTGWTVHHDASIYGGGYFDWDREVCFARVLRDAGYATAVAGKWQMNNLFEQRDAPNRHGFQTYCLFPDGPRGHPAHGRRYWDPYIIRDGRRVEAQGRFAPDMFTEFLIEFMGHHRKGPFLAFYPMSLMHLPAVETPANRGRPLDQRERFGGMVRYADHCIGRLVDALDRFDIRSRTAVLVTSDNGTPAAMGGRVAGRVFRAEADTMVEADLKEGEIDVPFVVNWPGVVPAGRTSQALIDCSDLFPTLLELANVPTPAGVTLDGRSFAPILRGMSDRQAPRQWIFSQYAGHRVIRDRRYKLHNDGRFYDLLRDPLERHPLQPPAESPQAAARQRLQRALDRLPRDAPLWFVPRSISARRLGLGNPAERTQDATRAPADPLP
ncbi:MAG TPA: hypothetical protein EYH34_16385 [Planctomycetes bacterium]|nr:hypothetical protein [Planctomycetota bacterium]